MSLADLMRKGGLQRVATATVATSATEGVQNARTVATVAGVAVANTTGSETETGGAVQSVATVATVAVANCPDSKAANDAAAGLTVARATPVAVANLPDSTAAPADAIEAVPTTTTTTPDPDRWCWPHSDAMTGAEIDRFTGRLALFTAKGLSPNDAEVLADKLLIRDRDGDDRRACLECAYLSGWAGRRQCRGLQYAGMGGPQASAGQVAMLQRCNGFKAAS